MVAERYAGPGDRINDNKIVKLAQIDPLVVQVVVPDGLYGQIKADAGARSLSTRPSATSRFGPRSGASTG